MDIDKYCADLRLQIDNLRASYDHRSLQYMYLKNWVDNNLKKSLGLSPSAGAEEIEDAIRRLITHLDIKTAECNQLQQQLREHGRPS